MPTVAVMPTFSTRSFFVDKAARTFSAELSSLGCPAGKIPQAFMLNSQWTGRDVIFEVAEVLGGEETDGEVTTIRYTSKGYDNLTAILFND